VTGCSPHRGKKASKPTPACYTARRFGGALAVIVEKRRIDNLTLLNVEGVIKLGESAEFFAQALESALAEEAGHVLVDFSRINYIDSTGIGELVGYLGRFQDANRKLILVNPSDRIRRLLDIAQLSPLFTIHESLAVALEAEGVRG
jgi:anti-sigma B factor antagonist